MRYELETPLHERYNRSTLGFDTSYTQPISAAAQAALRHDLPRNFRVVCVQTLPAER